MDIVNKGYLKYYTNINGNDSNPKTNDIVLEIIKCSFSDDKLKVFADEFYANHEADTIITKELIDFLKFSALALIADGISSDTHELYGELLDFRDKFVEVLNLELSDDFENAFLRLKNILGDDFPSYDEI